MENPVKKLRRSTKLSVRAFSALYGCSYETVYKAEGGFSTKAPNSVVQALRNAGVKFEEEQLQKDYKAWQLMKAKEELEQKKNAAC